MTSSAVNLVCRLTIGTAVFVAVWASLCLTGVQHWTVTGGDAAALAGLIGGTVIAYFIADKKNG